MTHSTRLSIGWLEVGVWSAEGKSDLAVDKTGRGNRQFVSCNWSHETRWDHVEVVQTENREGFLWVVQRTWTGAWITARPKKLTPFQTRLGWKMLVKSKPISPTRPAEAFFRPRSQISISAQLGRRRRSGLWYPLCLWVLCSNVALFLVNSNSPKILNDNYAYCMLPPLKISMQQLSLHCSVCLGLLHTPIRSVLEVSLEKTFIRHRSWFLF